MNGKIQRRGCQIAAADGGVATAIYLTVYN